MMSSTHKYYNCMEVFHTMDHIALTDFFFQNMFCLFTIFGMFLRNVQQGWSYFSFARLSGKQKSLRFFKQENIISFKSEIENAVPDVAALISTPCLSSSHSVSLASGSAVLKMDRPSLEHSCNLIALVDTINHCPHPKILDLRGATFKALDWRTRKAGRCLKVTSPGVTLVNGILDLDAGMFTFCVCAPGFVMKHVTVRGGNTCISVKPGGSVSLTCCQLIGAKTGAVVGTPEATSDTPAASLCAHDMLVADCRENGIQISKDGEVQLSSCTVGGCGWDGVVVSGGRACKLEAKNASFMQNRNYGLHVKSPLQAQLVGCIADGNGVNNLPNPVAEIEDFPVTVEAAQLLNARDGESDSLSLETSWGACISFQVVCDWA